MVLVVLLSYSFDSVQRSLVVINELLLPFNVLEHVLALGQINVVGEHLGILFIKFVNFGQPFIEFIVVVKPRDGDEILPFQELAHVVVDQVVLEHGHKVGGLVVHDVCDHFGVVVVSAGQIFSFQVLLNHNFYRIPRLRLAKRIVQIYVRAEHSRHVGEVVITLPLLRGLIEVILRGQHPLQPQIEGRAIF